MKHVVPFYPIVCQTPKEDFFKIGQEVAGGEIISVKWKKFSEIVKKIKGDVVHAHGRGFPLPEACSLFAKKSIYTPHNDTLGVKSWTRKVRKFLFNKYDKIVVQTKFGKQNLVREGVKREKIVVIPNPVDYKFFSRPRGGKKFRNKFGLDKNEKFAISIGIRPLKNPQVIVNACKKAGIRVVLVGPTTKSDVKKTWKDSGFDWYLPPKEIFNDRNVILTGQLDSEELSGAFDAATLYINSSKYENFGLAVYEAASAGLALCLPNQKTFDIFRGCALFHDSNNTEKLASNILRYMENKTLIKRNGRKAKEIAKDFDYDKTKLKFKKLYEDFLK